MDQDFILNNGSGGISCKGCGRGMGQLHSFDYLAGVPGADDCEYVEVQFKNTRKGFFINSNNIPLEKGDIVAVESNPGHDIGTVTMTGRLVKLQMKKANLRPDIEIKRVYRKAREVDMEKYAEAKAREHDTMIRSRQIAKDLGLEMKIGDVEYQGDGLKAIFYYSADGRVDFRQLIKVLADAFHVRIEMKQIGARQEAGRIGGIGQHLDELTEIHAAVGNVVEDCLEAVTLILHVAYLHLQTQVLGNLAGAYHGVMLAGLGLSILLHVNLTSLAVYAFDLDVGAQVGLLHLELNQTAGHGDCAYVVAGIGFHSYNIALFQRQLVGVDEESLAGVLELNLNVVTFIGPWHAGQIVK